MEFKSLSEVVSNHLDSQITALNEELKNITLDVEEKANNGFVQQIEQLKIIEDESLPCNFDSKDLLEVQMKLVKTKTNFARVLCRKYKRSVLKLTVLQNVVPKKIKIFDFAAPSPDDGIKRYLKK